MGSLLRASSRCRFRRRSARQRHTMQSTMSSSKPTTESATARAEAGAFPDVGFAAGTEFALLPARPTATMGDNAVLEMPESLATASRKGDRAADELLVDATRDARRAPSADGSPADMPASRQAWTARYAVVVAAVEVSSCRCSRVRSGARAAEQSPGCELTASFAARSSPTTPGAVVVTAVRATAAGETPKKQATDRRRRRPTDGDAMVEGRTPPLSVTFRKTCTGEPCVDKEACPVTRQSLVLTTKGAQLELCD